MLSEPLNNAAATALIKTIARTGDVAFAGHAVKALEDDSLSTVDAMNVLRAGYVEFSEFERGSWRYRMRTARIVVPVVFRSETELVVVTAWRITR